MQLELVERSSASFEGALSRKYIEVSTSDSQAIVATSSFDKFLLLLPPNPAVHTVLEAAYRCYSQT